MKPPDFYIRDVGWEHSPPTYYGVEFTSTGGFLSGGEDFATVAPTEEDQMARHPRSPAQIQILIGCVLLSMAILAFGAIILTAFSLLACLIYFAGILAIVGLAFVIAGADNL